MVCDVHSLSFCRWSGISSRPRLEWASTALLPFLLCICSAPLQPSCRLFSPGTPPPPPPPTLSAFFLASYFLEHVEQLRELPFRALLPRPPPCLHGAHSPSPSRWAQGLLAKDSCPHCSAALPRTGPSPASSVFLLFCILPIFI